MKGITILEIIIVIMGLILTFALDNFIYGVLVIFLAWLIAFISGISNGWFSD
jgi:uncharacterized membrane protein